MSTTNLGDLMFWMLSILALLIGLFARSERKACLITFAIGLFYCLMLFLSKIPREMGGIFETFAFAGFSAAICGLRKQFYDKNRK
jgi:hypothetical protein